MNASIHDVMKYRNMAIDLVIHENIIHPFEDGSFSQADQDAAVKIGDAIAAAVQAEREANAELAKSMIGATRHEIAAAIRARGNGSAAEPALYDDKISDEEADALDTEQEEEAAEFLNLKPVKPKRSKQARGNGRE